MSNKGKLSVILRYAILLVIILACIFGLRIFFESRGTDSYTAPVKAVTTIRPVQTDLEKILTFPGYIESETMVPVVPFVSGTILEYNIKAGDQVEKDQVLAVIDPSPYQLQKQQAEAQYYGYQSAFERIEALYNSGSTTQQNYDTLKAQRDAAQAQLELAELQLSYTNVKAPISGTVIMAPSSQGSIGTITSPVAVLADITSLIVNLEIPEKYYTIFNDNLDSLRITVHRLGQYEASEVEAGAVIESIAPYINPESKTFALRLKLSDHIQDFKPGMYIKVDIAYDYHSEVYALPQRVKKSDGSVYILTSGSIAQTLSLEDIFETNEMFEVPSEYKDYDFILTGQNTILSGELVQVVEE